MALNVSPSYVRVGTPPNLLPLLYCICLLSPPGVPPDEAEIVTIPVPPDGDKVILEPAIKRVTPPFSAYDAVNAYEDESAYEALTDEVVGVCLINLNTNPIV